MFGGFYTLGGGHFWEDVFFYQKWRIQRNYVTKKCRLLDNWDISRFEGSFEECRRAFIQFIEAFELPRQKGHMVIMLPGLGESKNIFKPLWRAVLKEGFLAAAVNYPSTQKEIDGHVRQLDFFLNHLEDVEKVSFVTNGAGSIILKRLFMLETPWRQHLKIGRAVEVRPLNHGSRLLKKLSRSKLFGFILGPMAAEMSPAEIEKIPPLPKEIETGIVLSESLLTRILEKLTGTGNERPNPEAEKQFEKAADVVEITSHKWNIFNSKDVTDAVTKFLLTGKF